MYSYVDDAEAVAKCSGCGVLFDTVFNHKFNCKFCGTLVKTPKRYADDPDDPITLEIQKELDIPTFIRRQREARAAA